MAQIPWTIINSQPVSCAVAKTLLHCCQKDIIKHLTTSESHTLTVSMNQISEALELNAFESRFHSVTAIGTIQLHPSYLDRLSLGIRTYLTNFLLRFVPEFDGIWVGYGKFDPLDTVGFIPNAEQWGFSIFDICVECLVFKPTTGSHLVGVVQQVRPTHIALLVHGFFNAYIQRNRIPGDYIYTKAKKSYKHSKNKASVTVQSLLKFKIVKYQYSESAELLSIEGSIEDTAETGVVDKSGEMLERESDSQDVTH